MRGADGAGCGTRNRGALGLKAALDEANEKGGVGGRKITLRSLDDAYEPVKCVECTSKLIEEEGVFALAGYVGTPTTKVAMPIVQEMKVPLIGAFTGAMLLRDPVQRYVFNIRASYDDETETLVQYLTKQGGKKIAVFYQNDSFGQAGLSGVEKALDGTSSLDLDGMKLSFSAQNHQASSAVFLTRVKGGKAEPVAP